MHYLKRMKTPPTSYNARAQWPRIIREGRVKRCSTCTYLVPESDITIEDGVEHCPMCVDTMTAEWKANEEQAVAQVKSDAIRRLFNPPQFSVRSLKEDIPAAITSITDSTGADVHQSRPLNVRTGVSSTLFLGGQHLDTLVPADVSARPSAGIALTYTPVSATASHLAVLCSAVGVFSILYQNHTYRNIVSAR